MTCRSRFNQESAITSIIPQLATIRLELSQRIAVSTWNAAMLMSVDLAESMLALREQRKPEIDG